MKIALDFHICISVLLKEEHFSSFLISVSISKKKLVKMVFLLSDGLVLSFHFMVGLFMYS